MAILKCIIAGGRDFNDFDVLQDTLNWVFDAAIERGDDISIISGTARGADQMGERYATDHQLHVARYPADWNRYGKSAGYKRNEQMAYEATHLVAFWDGKSRGTKHMIDIACANGLNVRVFDYDGRMRFKN